jgi:signal recognition particle GTPase
LGSTIAQFVQEYTMASQPFDPAKDRFVLITGPQSSAGIKWHLTAFLTRMRTSFDPAGEWEAGSQDDQSAANVLRDHITREWQATTGTPITNADLTALVRLIHVHILDVDPGGHAEQEANSTLRQRILKNPTEAGTAWNTLVTTTGTYAANHQRADRPALQRALIEAGIDLQAQRSYREDIERLKAHTATMLVALLDFSRINVGKTVVSIQRAPTRDAQAAAKDAHLLILGTPGAGKSGALHELTYNAGAVGTDVVLFAVDQLAAVSLGALRNELGLTHELATILDHWPGTEPGYLIIDALDAARTDGAVRMLHALMDQVIKSNNRWRVIASVRKFDLRYNTKLQQLFSGPPPTPYTDNEFSGTRHVNIPTLTDAELAQVGQQSPELAALITAASAPLQELLRVPFNLRLLAELVGTGVAAAELQPLRTQLDLLDRYWKERIIRNDDNGDGREVVLRRTTDAMVLHRRMRIQRAEAIAGDSGSGPYLRDLLSTHVLSEWTSPAGTSQHDVLTFPHHLLFDYAVARLSVPADDHELIARLTAEPDLLLAIRPSIDLYLQRGWHTDQGGFWTLAFSIIESTIPEVGKLIAPGVAALHTTMIKQIQPLLACLQDPARHEPGVAALQHVLATLLMYGRTSNTPTPGPWIAFLDQASEALTPQLANTIRPYTIFLSEHAQQLTNLDCEHLERIARRLLAHALQHRYSLLTINSINAVAMTITTDQQSSITLLRECIAQEHLCTLGHQTLRAIAQNIRVFAAADPAFARDAYINAFRYRDTSTDPTSMGDSQILPMRSHRKQDYDGGLYQLAQHYPAVLAVNPLEAITAVLTVIDEHVRTKHKPADNPVPVKFNAEDTTLLQDYSRIWDETGSHDSELTMLDALQHFLERITDPQAIQEYLRQIVAYGPPAVVWRRLLTAGANQPSTIGHALRSLTWDPNILIEFDTTKPIGQLLKAINVTLTPEEREQVENAIMSIPTINGVNADAANHCRDRLLGCLDPNQLVTNTARERYTAIMQAGGPPANEEESVIADWSTLDPTPHAQDPLLGPLLEPIAAFGSQHLNTTPSSDAIAAILPHMKTLSDVLATVDPTSAIQDAALTDLAQCTVAIARSENLKPDQAAILLPIALTAAKHPNPAVQENDDPTRPVTGWSPAPRITGAQAITALARHETCYTKDTRDAIRRLSTDPVRTVRVQVAGHILALYKTDPGFMWELIENWATGDENPTVLHHVVHALNRLPASLADKTVPLTITIFNRKIQDSELDRVREGCVNIWVGLTVWANDATSKTMLDQLLADPRHYAHDLQRMIIALEAYLLATEQHISEAAFMLLRRLLTSVTDAMRDVENANGPTSPWPPEAQAEYTNLFGCADTVAQRLYFASGAFKNPGHERPLLPPQQFYLQAKPLFDRLSTIGHPHTTQYLVDTLQYFIDTDPAGVLLLIGTAVTAGSKYGYQYEQLAEGLIVRIVERYLAEFRPLLRERPDCHTALMRILDVFVRVGWPSAHQLTYQLSAIYR